MTKPLQGTAFRVMRAKLMNCPVNYEDTKEDERTPIKSRPISAAKTVTWKCVISTPFKALQECVEQNRISAKKPVTDRCTRRISQPHVSTSSGLGSVRLARRTWQVGEAGDNRPKQ
jgi:hypothetical protein